MFLTLSSPFLHLTHLMHSAIIQWISFYVLSDTGNCLSFLAKANVDAAKKTGGGPLVKQTDAEAAAADLLQGTPSLIGIDGWDSCVGNVGKSEAEVCDIILQSRDFLTWDLYCFCSC